MKIRYENTLEDITAFHRHLYSDNAVLAGQKTRATVFLPVIWIVLTVAFYLLTGDPKVFRFGGIGIVVYVFLVYRIFRSGLANRIRLLYGNAKEYLCEHQLEVTEDGMCEMTATRECRHTWSGIFRIVAEGEFAFIYTGTTDAYIVSRKNMREGNFDEFVTTAKLLWQQKNDSVLPVLA